MLKKENLALATMLFRCRRLITDTDFVKPLSKKNHSLCIREGARMLQSRTSASYSIIRTKHFDRNDTGRHYDMVVAWMDGETYHSVYIEFYSSSKPVVDFDVPKMILQYFLNYDRVVLHAHLMGVPCPYRGTIATPGWVIGYAAVMQYLNQPVVPSVKSPDDAVEQLIKCLTETPYGFYPVDRTLLS